MPNSRYMVNQKDSKGYTPLHIAAKIGDSAMVALLIKYNSDLDSWDMCGFTPRDLAMVKNHTKDFIQQFDIKKL